MKKERHLISTEMHTADQEYDIKKIMNNIDYLDTIVDMCDNKSVLEMYKTMSGLCWIHDRELIKLSEFKTASRKLEEIGKKFKTCNCQKRM